MNIKKSLFEASEHVVYAVSFSYLQLFKNNYKGRRNEKYWRAGSRKAESPKPKPLTKENVPTSTRIQGPEEIMVGLCILPR